MEKAIKLLVEIVNDLHDIFIELINAFGGNLNDKQMHFIVIGVLGMIIFFITNSLFKAIAKYSITAISFIYTSTVMIIFVFAIEIQQKITGRGKMEFEDITAGLWGFIEGFAIYLLFRLVIMGVKILLNKDNNNNNQDKVVD